MPGASKRGRARTVRPRARVPWHDATRVVHAGQPKPAQGEPFLPGPTFAAKFHLYGDPASAKYTYGRHHNPTWTRFEDALGELEGGTAVSFGSGIAAITAVMNEVLLRRSTRSVLVMPSDAYSGGRKLVTDHFARRGVEVRWAPTANDAQAPLVPGATLLWLESPSNPLLDVCDLRRMISLAHRSGALVAVDNTTATCLGQRPLELGADFSISSDSKTVCGHSDVVLGHATSRDPAWAERLRAFRTEQGAIPGPMEVWLAHRSLATLDVRFERQCSNAGELARFLLDQPAVRSVRYPGLPGDPSYPVARRQMSRFGPIIGFTLASAARAERLLRRARIVRSATSFGGVHSTAERRARWGSDDVPAGFVRLSAGCEDIADLRADLRYALG
ncbi:MAG: cystathionine gamma-lyase [Thermoplasmata archaeon]